MNGEWAANGLKSITIQQYKTDIGFRTLVEGVNENLYIIPKYQRKYRWTKDQVTSLVESLICGLPIPPIYTCRNSQNQLEILDGQQRIMSLFFYYIGFYLNNRKNSSINFSELIINDNTFEESLLDQFELEELHISLVGNDGRSVNVDYRSLPPELKRRVDYTTITVIEIKINDEKRKSEVLRQIFANLNKGGTLLSSQEQRNGIYVCPFYDMLQDFNRNNQKWRKLWGREDASERDMETLLRLCAMKRYARVRKRLLDFEFRIEGYKSSYGELLDRFSEEVMEFESREIDEYKNSLSAFLNLFQMNGKPASKVALFESFYVVHETMNVNKPITAEIYNAVLENPRYKQYARQGTVKMRSMDERWKIVYEIWTGADR